MLEDSSRTLITDRTEVTQNTKGHKMSIWWLLFILVIWFALQAYILPKLGIST
jgi:hypothetical protein